MKMQDRVIKPKLVLLKPSGELGNVSKACRASGYSWDIYRFKDQHETGATWPYRIRTGNERSTHLSSMLFHLIKAGHEHGSIIITSKNIAPGY